ncbi:hypothetical protein FXO38_02235 [Capsicum annuum]|nr:hypothetical protein FXO38_02235 [Capsicum annuum]
MISLLRSVVLILLISLLTLGVGLGLAPGGVPYYYPPLGQPPPGGVMLGRPAVPAGVVPGDVPGVVPGTVPGTVPGVVPGAIPGVDPSMYVPHLPFQVWQSMWQTSEDHLYPVEVEVAVDRVPMTAKSEVKLEVMEGHVISLSIVNSPCCYCVKMRDVLAQMDLDDALLGFDKMPSLWTDEDKWRKDQKALSQIHLHFSNQIL